MTKIKPQARSTARVNPPFIAKTSTTVLTILFCLLTSACGGGLYGTGTGEEGNAIDVDATDPVTTDLPSQPATMEPDTGGEHISEAPEPGGTIDQSLTFTNLEPSGDTSAPLLKIVNLSASSVNVRLNSDPDMLFEEDVQPGSGSGVVSLPEGVSELLVLDTGMADRSTILDPVLVGNDTLSTLIVFDESSGSSRESALPTFPLTTRSATNAPGVALVRIVSAPGLEPNQSLSGFSLLPSGEDPGAGEVSFGSGTTDAATGAAVTEYQLVSPGDYVPGISSHNSEPRTLSLSSQTVYTLILTGDEKNPVYTEIDGQP